jgi:hypothetical protein
VRRLLAVYARLLAPCGTADLARQEARPLHTQSRHMATKRAPGDDEHRRAVSVLQSATMAGRAIRAEPE